MATVDRPRIVATQAELAIALGKSERMVRNYVRDGMPGQTGCWDIEDAREWISRNVNSQDDGGGDLKEKRLRAEIRKLNAEAEAKETKNEQLQGLLLNREDVEQAVSEAFLRVKTRLEAMPDEIEMSFPADQRAFLKSEVANKVRLTLAELAAFELEVGPVADAE